MLTITIIALTFIAFSGLAFYLLGYIEERHFWKNRLATVINGKPGSDFVHEQKSEIAHRIAEWLSNFGQDRLNDKSRFRKQLRQAGYHNAASLRVFIGLKFFSSACLLGIFLFMGIAGKAPLPLLVLVAFGMAGMGYILPNFLLSSRAQRRQQALAKALPDALDFLLICVEAGLGLNAAIVRVGKELSYRSKELSGELLLVMQEMRSGLSREEALRNLSDRNEVKELKTLTGAIILSDKLGTNLSDTLRVQSDFMRTRILQRAEEGAAKAGIKLLLPLVLFIMPAIFVVILGPGIVLATKKLFPILF